MASVVQHTHSALNTRAFIPHVIRYVNDKMLCDVCLEICCVNILKLHNWDLSSHSCAASPVLKIRQMAARALRPLLSDDDVTATLLRLLDDLSSHGISQNRVHGLLLQVRIRYVI